MECTNFSIYGLFNSLAELFHVGWVRDEAVMKEFVEGVMERISTFYVPLAHMFVGGNFLGF